MAKVIITYEPETELEKKGGRVMIVTQGDLAVDNIVMGQNLEGVLKLWIKKSNNKRDFAIVYVLPKTNA